MWLVPTISLIVMLEIVAIQQRKAENRVSVAIPVTDLISFCDSLLLDDGIAIAQEYLLTHGKQLASRQTNLPRYEAKVITMPYPDSSHSALEWILSLHI